LGFSNQQVVKLNEGPAFPQDPEEISNFWKFLHSWEGNWMWEGIDNDQDKKSDMSWKAEGMTHNSLIWVTDGSYNRKKARDLSGVGWIIFRTRTGLRLTGTFWEKSTGANLYPVEMLSLCAFHLLEHRWWQSFTRLTNGQPSSDVTTNVHLNFPFTTDAPIRPSAKCADICAIKQSFTGNFKYIHVVIGHGIGGNVSQLKWRVSLKARRWSKR
jgi:hypothetical protein